MSGGAAPGLDHRQQAKNVTSNYLALLVSFGSVLVLTPLLVDWLGDVQFGLWVLVASVAGYLGLLDLGLRPSVVKYVAQYRAMEDSEALSTYASTVFVLYLGVGFLALLAAWGVGAAAGPVLDLEPDLHGTVRSVFLLTGVCVALAFQNGLAGGVLEGFQRYDLNNGIAILTQTLIFAGTVALVFARQGLVSLVALQAAVAALGLALRLVQVRRKLGVTFRARSFRMRALKTGLAYGSWAFVLAVATQIVFQTDHIVISLVLSVSLVTTYAIAWRLVDAVNRVVFQTVNVLLPLFSEFDAREKEKQQRELYLEGVRIALAVAVPFYVTFLLLGDRLILAWIGPGYEDAYPVLVALSLAFLIHVPGHVAAVYLLGTGEHRALALISILSALLNLVLSVVLALWIGILGVALATGLSFLVAVGVLIPAQALRLSGVKPLQYVVVVAGPVCTGAALAVLGALVLPPEGGPAVLLLEAVGIFVVFFAVYVTVVIGRADRDRYVRAIRKALGREPAPCD